MKKVAHWALRRTLHGRAALTHRQRLGRWPNLLKPRTFNEKVLYKCLHDRRDLLVKTADKVAVREFVRERIGGDYLTPLLQVIEQPSELDLTRLPNEFVAKANHGSGPDWYRIVTGHQAQQRDEMPEVVRRWLSQPFQPNGYQPWYWRIPRKVLVEQFLGDPDLGPPDDVKVFAMRGSPVLVQVDRDRLGLHRRSFFDTTWRLLDVEADYPPLGSVPPPRHLTEILDIATTLSEGFDFVRVDLFEVDGCVRFGELTHTPHAGTMQFSPASFDGWLGKLWDEPTLAAEATY